MTDAMPDSRQIPGPERIDMLDAIRGFALFGILLMNLEAFNGPITLALSGIDPSLHGTDRFADAFIYLFVQGKFWTLFSLLFGIGFAIMHDSAARAGNDFRRIYKRRLRALLVIGAAHGILIWEGDILFAYALAGFLLLWRLKTDAVPRLWPIVLIYTLPLACIALAGAFAQTDGQDGVLAKLLAEEIRVQGHSSYPEALTWRLGFFAQSLGNLVILLPLTFAIFSLGVRLHRTGWSMPASGRPDGGGRRALACYASGLILMLASIGYAPHASPVAINMTFAVVNILNMLAGILMALGMFFGIRQLWDKPAAQAILARLAPIGRMALTNYLMQSLLCTLFFNGYGLGYFQQLPRAWHIPFALALTAVQALYSTWWLKRYRIGPVEYLWRWLTYGKRPKFVS
jgi:uncharacterized protein